MLATNQQNEAEERERERCEHVAASKRFSQRKYGKDGKDGKEKREKCPKIKITKSQPRKKKRRRKTPTANGVKIAAEKRRIFSPAAETKSKPSDKVKNQPRRAEIQFVNSAGRELIH